MLFLILFPTADIQVGKSMVTLIKKTPQFHAPKIEPGLFFTDNACSQSLLLSSQIILCGTII